MGFNPTFYAGRPKLSEITIDSDLDMGGRDISGVDTLRASGSEVTIDSDLNMGGRDISGVDLIRAGRIDSPYRPDLWPTENLDWGDVAPSAAVNLGANVVVPAYTSDVSIVSWSAPAGASYRWTLNLVSANQGGSLMTVTIKVNGAVVETFPQNRGTTVNKVLNLPSGALVTVTASNSLGAACIVTTASYYQCTGVIIGPKTFNLTGKWLALGIDMQGLAATVKIQGVNMPYSDYAKYFPLAPTELTIPGGWDASQIRPIVEVYV